MDNFEKRQAAIGELVRDAGRSDRVIAAALGLSPGLVRKVRWKLEQDGTLQPGKRVGKDGRRRGLPHRTLPEIASAPQTSVADLEDVEVAHVGADERDMPHSTVQTEPTPIRRFTGAYRWLSNFWPAKVSLDGMEFKSVEHAFQAAKTTDPKVRGQIAALPTPSRAKQFGRRLKLRPDWDNVKLTVMEDLLGQKFRIPELREKLLDTGDAYLEETNRLGDVWWGVSGGKGKNHLGKSLMKVRDDEFVKEGMVFVMVVVQGWPEQEAREAAEDTFGDVVDAPDRRLMIEQGKKYWSRRRSTVDDVKPDAKKT